MEYTCLRQEPGAGYPSITLAPHQIDQASAFSEVIDRIGRGRVHRQSCIFSKPRLCREYATQGLAP
jgi:hypothetical protein